VESKCKYLFITEEGNPISLYISHFAANFNIKGKPGKVK
jgi:hypothetical protein